VGVFVSDFDLLVGDLTGHGVETALNLSKTHIFFAETDLSQDGRCCINTGEWAKICNSLIIKKYF